MRLVYQTIKHDPENGRYGNCHQAAIASVLGLDIEAVPHFGHDDPPATIFFERESEFLAAHGLFAVTVPVMADPDRTDGGLPNVLANMAAWNGSDFVYLLGGRSPRGFNHTVVCRGGEIVHDPSPCGGGIVAPSNDGLFWLSMFASRPVSKQDLPLPVAHRQSA